MKKLLTPLVFLALLLSSAALAYTVAQHREQYLLERQASALQEQENASDRQNQIEALDAKLAEQTQETERLMGECLKGVEAYGSLTPFNKNRLPTPVCEQAEGEVAPPELE